MITKKEFNCIKGLVETENQLLNHLNESRENISEPQLREEIQKLTASVNNQKSRLLNVLEGKNE